MLKEFCNLGKHLDLS